MKKETFNKLTGWPSAVLGIMLIICSLWLSVNGIKNRIEGVGSGLYHIKDRVSLIDDIEIREWTIHNPPKFEAGDIVYIGNYSVGLTTGKSKVVPSYIRRDVDGNFLSLEEIHREYLLFDGSESFWAEEGLMRYNPNIMVGLDSIYISQDTVIFYQ